MPTPLRSIFRRAALAGLALLAVFALTGFQGKAAHGVAPTPLCDVGCTSADVAAATLDTQEKLAHTKADLVVDLVKWSDLENCVAGTGAAPAATIDNGVHTCSFNSTGTAYDAGGTPCRCYYNLAPLEHYLDAYVGSQAAAGGLGMDALLQIAPVFTAFRSVPPYLWDTPFSDQAMKDAFSKLWDQVSLVLGKPKYQDRRFLISIGNEVNFYLTSPNPAPRTSAISGEATSQEAWDSYKQFFQSESEYVRTTGAPNVTRIVGVTLTWGACGGGADVASQSLGGCDQILKKYLPGTFDNAWVTGLTDLADANVFTNYYKFSKGTPASDISNALLDDFYSMSQLGYSGGQRPVFLQEIGHPSSKSSPTDALLEAEQAEFVRSTFDDIGAVNTLYRANGGWTPFEGFSFFPLHDFSANVVDRFFDCTSQACPAGFTCNSVGAGDGRWFLRDADSGPGARQEPDLAFDPQRSRVVLFGGVEVPPDVPTINGFQDTWVADVSSDPRIPPAPWRQLTTTGGPPSGNGSDSVYVPSLDRVITVAQNASNGMLEFWALAFGSDGNTGTWTQLHPSGGSIEKRPFGRAIYDPVRDRVLYFGGRSSSGDSSQSVAILDLTQGSDGALSSYLWSTIPGREEFGFLFDAAANRAIVYGGADSTQRFDDAWQVDFSGGPGGAVSPLGQPAGSPGQRTFFTWANDEADKRALLFGGLVGATGSGTLMNDVWQADYSVAGQLTWSQLQPDSSDSGLPSVRGRIGATATFVPSADRMFVYGGIADLAYTPLKDTWELQFAPSNKCMIANAGCTTDSECAATATSLQLPPQVLKCCLDPAFCSATQLHTCVVPSTCDLSAALLPTLACPDGNASACSQSQVCNSAHRCVDANQRSDFCSWGLIGANGVGKAAWDVFQEKSSQFVP